MKKTALSVALVVSGVFAALISVPASASIVYMTGTVDPWGQTSNDDAMDAAFGIGNWTKFQGFSAAAFVGASFIFIDGGDASADDFGDFLVAEFATFSSYLASGGRALVHAAPNQDKYAEYVLPEGLTLDGIAGFTYPTASEIASLTAAGLAIGLDAAGAGTDWTGTFFSHNAVFGGTCLIEGSAGCILAQSGNLWAGGETTSNFHFGADPFQLRVNELLLASAGGAVPVSEPPTWALMILGLGLVGSALRRRGNVAAA